jgi:hypothetical protein
MTIDIDTAIKLLEFLRVDYATNGFNGYKESLNDEYDFDTYSGDYGEVDYDFTPDARIMFDEIYFLLKKQWESGFLVDQSIFDDLDVIESIPTDTITDRVNSAFKYIKQYLNKIKSEQTSIEIISKD